MEPSARSSDDPEGPDLGFIYRVRKSGEIEIRRRGCVAAILRGRAAVDFLAEAEIGFAAAQGRWPGSPATTNAGMSAPHASIRAIGPDRRGVEVFQEAETQAKQQFSQRRNTGPAAPAACHAAQIDPISGALGGLGEWQEEEIWGYYPGVISSALIYIPLAIYAYAGYLSAGQPTWPQAGLSVLLGAACMGLLMAYVLRRQVHAGGMRGSKKLCG